MSKDHFHKYSTARVDVTDDCLRQFLEALLGQPSCESSEGWRVQQEVNLPGQQSGAP
jgi:hypothetical protein